jgi:hypothetical protein
MAVRVYLTWKKRCKKFGGLEKIKKSKITFMTTFIGHTCHIV